MSPVRKIVDLTKEVPVATVEFGTAVYMTSAIECECSVGGCTTIDDDRTNDTECRAWNIVSTQYQGLSQPPVLLTLKLKG